MKRLYQPIKANGLLLKNRIVMSPMSMHNTLNGHATKRDILFYEARAKGGAGLIIFANMQWDKERYDEHSGALLISEEYIPTLREVTDTVHKYGCAMFAQLMHIGRYASSTSARAAARRTVGDPYSLQQI